MEVMRVLDGIRVLGLPRFESGAVFGMLLTLPQILPSQMNSPISGLERLILPLL
jgi:hypothetical protein